MYQEHFGLIQEPFSIAPDPSFLFLSESHNEALAHLLYGFSHGGFVLISGEVGTGKTTLLRNLLDRTPSDVDVAFILNPRLTVRELLETLCEELGIDLEQSRSGSVKQYIDILNKHLLRTHQAGRSTVVVIDEAQNLTPVVLEQIRLLTNLETNEKKLLRIILLGQPELEEMLAKTELRQLSQRITARYELKPLSKEDTHKYVSHRLALAGGNPDLFTERAVNSLYRYSKGTPRLVNVIADRAMLGAFVQGAYSVTPELISGAAKEVLGKSNRFDYPTIAAIVCVFVLLAMFWAGWSKYFSDEQTDTEQTSTVEEGVLERSNQRNSSAADGPVVRTPEQTVGASSSADSAPLANRPFSRPGGGAYTLQRQAFAALFQLWGAFYADSTDAIPCDFAPQVGLQCLRKSGGWSDLEAMNKPAVLELWDNQPEPYYGALLRVDEGRYRLQIGSEQFEVTPRDLRDSWFGSYIVLWQTPPNYNGSLRQGDRESTVVWLRERLAEIQGERPPQANELFDTALTQAVVAFQSSEGLEADGVVGPMTWIRINSYLNNNSPRLLP